MTRPDLDALAALLDKATPFAATALERDLVNALPALIAYVRELEQRPHYPVGVVDAALKAALHNAAIAMRERCAQACEQGSVMQLGPLDIEAISHNIAVEQCAAAVRALEV